MTAPRARPPSPLLTADDLAAKRVLDFVVKPLFDSTSVSGSTCDLSGWGPDAPVCGSDDTNPYFNSVACNPTDDGDGNSYNAVTTFSLSYCYDGATASFAPTIPVALAQIQQLGYLSLSDNNLQGACGTVIPVRHFARGAMLYVPKAGRFGCIRGSSNLGEGSSYGATGRAYMRWCVYGRARNASCETPNQGWTVVPFPTLVHSAETV